MNVRRDRRSGWLLVALLLVGMGAQNCTATPPSDEKTGPAAGPPGRLVATFRTAPATYNRFVSPNIAEELVSRLTQATLVRLNRTTHEIEPWLATSWTHTPDGRTWTMKLREGVTWSDGTPFSVGDVLFTVRVVFDKKVGSDLADSLSIDGKPITASSPDPRTVVFTYPAPYGPGIALFDSLPILPRHKLEAAYLAGTFRDAWNLQTPPGQLVGLGPFVVQEFTAGQRLIFARNTRYWRTDEKGARLPYLSEIDLQFVSNQDNEVLRFEGGESDLMTDPVRAEDIAAFRTLVKLEQAQLADAGVSISPDGLWFNLKSGASPAKDRPWLQRDELRQAISAAVNRQAIADSVYFGAATPIFGPITPGHGDWYLPDLPRPAPDLARAKQLLASIGLEDRDGNGTVEDASRKPGQFSILVPKGSTTRERVTTLLQQQLLAIGLTVNVVALDTPSIIQQWQKGEYDAIYFSVFFDAFDPARNTEFWLSSGGFHFWNPGQKTPATPWEASIDRLMRDVVTSVDPAVRHRAFADVQRTFAAHMPIVYLVAPNVTIAASGRLGGVTASVLPPSVLWNAERLSLGADGAKPAAPRR